MDADIVNRFVASAQSVLQTEIGETIAIGEISAQAQPYTSQEITTLVGVTGTVEGVLMFGLSKSTARMLVSRMMGQEIQTFDELAQSGIAELGNVIAGTAVTSLSENGHCCKISPPTLIMGRGATISTVDIKRLVIPLVTPCGTVEMQMALKLNGRQPFLMVSRAAAKE